MYTELKELEEEIGELNGLDDDMLDATGFGYKPSSNVGSFISASMLPAGLKEQMEFFKEMEASEVCRKSKCFILSNESNI